jgi:hypothetical protein
MLQGEEKPMAASNASIRFLSDWRQEQQGGIERGGRLKIDYDKGRSPRCFTNWRGAEFGEIVASVRFHPRGEIINGSVLAPVSARCRHRTSAGAGYRAEVCYPFGGKHGSH